MENFSELQNLRLVERYLVDMICEVNDFRQVQVLTRALITVQQELSRIEGRSLLAARPDLRV
jgi:hypothetical protein